ncbi:SpaA isopeptide-forming pilin-related protein [Virgibacillus soli]|uniref:SpaA isopeptide-forming pilin-related protein n=1 Tax=Paracerasibacillus soli TaxID=480284 RepID=UPI0035E83FB8
MKKRTGLLLIMLLFFQTITSGFAAPMQMKAAESEQNVIKSLTVTETDIEGLVHVSVNWSIDGLEIDEGYIESQVLDEHLQIDHQQEGLLQVEETEIGMFHVTENGEITVAFLAAVEESQEASGTFVIEALVEVPGDNEEEETEQHEQSENDEKDKQAAPEEVAEDEKDIEAEIETTKGDELDSNDTALTATEIEENIITNVTLSKKVGEGDFEEIPPGSEIVVDNPYDAFKVKLDYEFALPNNHNYGAESTFTITIPEVFHVLANPEPTPLTNENGVEFATFIVTNDNKIVITFNENIEQNSNVSGYLHLESEFDAHYAGPAEGEVITFPISGEQTVTYPIKFIPKSTSIDKKGVPNKAYNAETIEWTVDFNKDLQEIEHARLEDVMEGDHTFIESSLKVYKLYMNADGTIDESKTEQLADDKFGTTFPLELGNIDSAYRIVYETEIQDDTGKAYKNTVELTGDNINPVEASATVHVNRGEALEKRASNYDPVTQTVTWEVKYNYDEKVIPQNKAKLTDIFGDNQAFVADSMEVVEVTIDPDTGEEDKSEPFTNYTLHETDGGFELQFNQNVSKAYKITYQTSAIDRVDESGNVHNKIHDEFGNEKEGWQWLSQGVFIKSHDNSETDYKEKVTGWTLRLNTDEYTMNDVVITDTLPKGFSLVEESVVVKHGGETITDYTLNVTETDGVEVFEIKFNDDITKEVLISFRTNIDFDKTEPNDDGTFTNHALLEWNNDDGEALSKEGTATFNPDTYTKANGFKGASYNAVTKEIEWEIGVNYNHANLDQAIVEDFILDGQNFDVDSIRVFHMDLQGGWNGYKYGEELAATDYTVAVMEDDEGNPGFRVSLGDINSGYIVTYKTDLNNQLVDKTYHNIATVKSDNQDSFNLTASVEPYHGGEYTKKTAEQNRENPRIVNWRVNINYAQSTVSNVSLSDTPSANQLLLRDTIKLYGTVVSENPNEIKIDRDNGPLVEDEDYALEITENEDGIETFTITFLEETIDQAYVLEYDTRIMYQGDGYIENDVKFEGDQTAEIPTDNAVKQRIDLSNIGGGIVGEVGSLEVIKVDAEDQKALAGATFELYETDGTFIRSYTTGEDGIVVFKNLLFDEYILKEVDAPEGYVAGIKDGQTVTVNAEVSKVTIENKKFVGDVTLTKVDADTKEVLEGVVFELRDEAGNLLQEGITTDEDGKILITGLTPGNYLLKETEALHGYQKLESEIPFTIKADQVEVLELDPIENSIILGTVQLIKVDADHQNEPLEGVVFKLVDAEGNVVKENLTTDREGKITVHDLRPGTYYFIETEALDDYVLDETPIEVVVERAQTEIATVQAKNELIPGSVELTKKGEDGKLLEGVKFELQDEDGNKISEHTTDVNGKLTVENLKPGFYQFVEVASIDGYELNKDVVKFEIIRSQKVAVSVEFTNELTPGSVELTKLGEENEVLEGAEFKLVDADEQVIHENLKTDENGKIIVGNLKPGTYYFVETKAPFGHELDETPVEVVIEFNQQKQLTVTKVNERTTSGVMLTKKGEDGKLLEGVIFALQDQDGNTLQQDLTTDENGVLTIDNLKPGHYQLVEIATNAGYVLDGNPITFEIELGQTKQTEVTLVNELATGSVELAKLGEEKEALADAEFALLDKDGNELQTGLLTNEDGKIVVTDLKPGHYQFVETKAPFGHELDQTPILFEVVFNQQETLTVTKENERTTGSVSLIKVDDETGETLTGAIFALQDREGNTLLEELTTDENGKIFVDDLKPGNYQFVEIKAPSDYTLDEEPIPFTIDLGQSETLEITTNNAIIKGDFELTKVDFDNEELVLEGVQFALQDSEGNTLQEDLTTDQDGKLLITNLRPGDYVLVETNPLFGYEAHDPIAFTIDRGQLTVKQITITNKQIRGGVVLTKVDKQDKQTVLSGAVFKLVNEAGETIKEDLVTDENGEIVVQDLKPGNYQFIEVKAPAGYELDQTPIDFIIDMGQTAHIQVTAYNEKTPVPTPEEEEKPEAGEKDTSTGLKDSGKQESDSGKELPKSATNIFNYILVGIALISVGIATRVILRRRKTV